MTTKETLPEQFTACYDENGWFVALKNAVKNLMAEQANWKTENLDNSIWEIVRYLNFYNEAQLNRFKGMRINRFGANACAESVFKELGFTVENVVKKAKKLI